MVELERRKNKKQQEIFYSNLNTVENISGIEIN